MRESTPPKGAQAELRLVVLPGVIVLCTLNP